MGRFIKMLFRILVVFVLSVSLVNCTVAVESLSLQQKSTSDTEISANLNRSSSDIIEAESLTTSSNHKIVISVGDPVQSQTTSNGYTVNSAIQ